MLPCPVIKLNGKLEHHNIGRMTNDSEPSGMKVWIIPPGKEPTVAEVLAEGQGNGSWKKVVLNTSYEPVIGYRKEDCNSTTFPLIWF